MNSPINIYLCLLSHESPEGVLQNVHFPLSIGFIGSYLKTMTKYEINIKLFKRPSELSKTLEENIPNIIMFGNYMWNEDLNLFYAESIKNSFTNTLVVIGGPNISLDEQSKVDFLNKYKFIDLLVEGDGEIIAKEIADQYFILNDVRKLKNIKIPNTFSIDHENHIFLAPDKLDTRIGLNEESLDIIESPYLNGLLDPFFEDGAIPLLESNRGCPYQCTYCQQATTYFKKIRYFSAERIKLELEYISKMILSRNIKMNIVEFSDPNFGMYKEDHPVFLAIQQNQNKYNFPSQVWCSSGKSQPQRILDHAKMLKKGSIMIRAAVQSMNKDTLNSVKRKNLPIAMYSNFSDEGVETYSDIMLCLPNENLKTYIEGFYELIDKKIDEFSMPTTLLLKGTPLQTDDQIELWGLKGKYRVIPECSNVYSVLANKRRVNEFECMICETNTMKFEDYLEARKFNLLVMIFHNTRLLKPFYRICDSNNLPRSSIIRSISEIKYKHIDFSTLLDEYVAELKSELFDKPVDLDTETDINNLTANKVFKFLSIAFMNYKDTLLNLICDALDNLKNDHFDQNKEFLLLITSQLFLENQSKFESTSSSFKIPFDLSKHINCESIEIGYSDFQVDRLNYLRNLYSADEVRIARLAYHLRPANMIKTMRFV